MEACLCNLNFVKSTLDNLFKTLSLNFPDTSFEVEFWDGIKEKYGSGIKKFKLVLKNKGVIKRILGGGSLGFGEEFMKGNILIEGDLQELIKMGYGQSHINFQLSLKEKLKIFYNYISSLGTVLNYRASEGSEDGDESEALIDSKRSISYHYDIGNDFYSLWLDSTLTYSCAYFKKKDDTLEQAQLQKYEHISKKLQLKQGETLVDIGCGWGGMMFYAAENFGVKCEGYTLSQKQYDYIIEEIRKRNLANYVKVYLKDYREARGKFDKFVSIGMFEHVGKKFHPVFFDIVKKILKPKGIGLLQTIGSPEDEPSDPWITKYIFPGGFIPALPAICNIMNQKDLVFFDIEDLRRHYALTLDKWIEGFEENIDKIRKVLIKSMTELPKEAKSKMRTKFSSPGSREKAEEFVRMWRLYLNGSSVSFKAGNNRLYQITFSNGLNNQLPLTRNYIYGA